MDKKDSIQPKQASRLLVHLPAILYGWFFFGMFLCGLLAPDHRVAELESSLVTQGWHLSAMACLFGIPILTAYWWRVRSPDSESGSDDAL